MQKRELERGRRLGKLCVVRLDRKTLDRIPPIEARIRSRMKTSWAYRVVRDNDTLTIRHVEVADDGFVVVNIADKDAFPQGETTSELFDDLDRMLRCLNLPILEAKKAA